MPYGIVAADVIQSSVSGVSLGAGNASIMKNRIINGAMVIDQRNAGASVSMTNGVAAYAVDRTFAYKDTTATTTAQRSTTAPTGFVNSFLFTTTTGGTVAAGGQNFIQQAIEGFNTADLSWGTSDAKTITISFWVRASLTGTYGIGLTNSAANRCYVATYSVSSANTWEYKTVTVAGDTTGTWLTDNGIGIRVRWDLGSGSTYQGTAGAWGTSLLNTTSAQTSVVGTSGATFYITGVQLEVGSSATGYEYRQYQQELALCQRYLPAFTFGAGEKLNVGQVISTTQVIATLPFPVTARTAATGITSSAGSSFALADASLNYGANQTGTAIAFESGGVNEGSVRFTCTSGLVAGNSSLPLSRFAGTIIQFTGCEL